MPETAEPETYHSVLDDLQISPLIGGTQQQDPAEPEKEPEKKDEKPPEPEKKETPPAPPPEPVKQPEQEAKPPGTRKPTSDKGQEDFKTVVEGRKAAEKRAAEIEEAKKTLEARVAEQDRLLAEQQQIREAAMQLRAQNEAMLAEYERLREETKAADLRRDPEFIEKYTKPREFHSKQLHDMAVGSEGANEPEIVRAIQYNDREKLAEIRESLPVNQTHRWDAIMRRLEDIELAETEALADSNKTYERIVEDRRKAEIKSKQQVREERRAIAARIQNEWREKSELVREDKELQQTLYETSEALCGGQNAESWTPEVIMRHAMGVHVLIKDLAKRDNQLKEEKEARAADAKKMEELEKTVADQNEFIKKRYGSYDFRNPPAAKKDNGDYDPDRPIHEQIVVRR